MTSILVISPENWCAHTVSKHHYARTLAETGYNVYFLNPPDSSMDDIVVEDSNYPGLKIVSGPKVARGLRYFPSFLRTFLEKRWLNRLEVLAGSKIDTIWLFENSRFFDMRFSNGRLKIYHQVDLNQNFHMEVASSTADICFCTSDLIRDRLKSHNELVFKIHHGTPDEVYRECLKESDLSRFPPSVVNAVYIGNMDMQYLDSDLLLNVVRSFPYVHFHFVGGYKNDNQLWQSLKEETNTEWWGKVDSNAIPLILDKADILLVAYKEAEWKNQSSPHKFMEYFASGKVIVSTYTDEYKDKRHLLEMTDSNSDYIQKFSEVLENLDKYNCSNSRTKRMEFARLNTYRNQLDKIIQLIKDSGFHIEKRAVMNAK